MINLINYINGYIRHNSQLVQLNHICVILDMQLLAPNTLQNKYDWFADFMILMVL